MYMFVQGALMFVARIKAASNEIEKLNCLGRM